MWFCNITIPHSSTAYDSVGEMFKLLSVLCETFPCPTNHTHASVTSAGPCIKVQGSGVVNICLFGIELYIGHYWRGKTKRLMPTMKSFQSLSLSPAFTHFTVLAAWLERGSLPCWMCKRKHRRILRACELYWLLLPMSQLWRLQEDQRTNQAGSFRPEGVTTQAESVGEIRRCCLDVSLPWWPSCLWPLPISIN